MPITLPPISRRRFLAGSLAATAAAVYPSWLRAAADAAIDPHRFVLISDIHIDADRKMAKMKTNPWDNFRRATEDILRAVPGGRPAAALINGDLTHHQGNPEDYVTVIDALAPIRAAGLPLHMTMGNHDNRGNFWKALPADDAREKAIEDRQTLLIESPRANLLILDSLDKVAQTPGLVGPQQLAWLSKTLDAHPDKPAIVFTHHDPDQRTEADKKDPKKKLTGLTDTQALLDVLLPRKQVKAHVFGHTHTWTSFQREGLHFVNLPPTAWVFKEGRPQGWTDLRIGESGASFELRCLDAKHPQHGEKFDLKWR
jgi:3',5'-cyclic AMP phosphodiesterase CpdA